LGVRAVNRGMASGCPTVAVSDEAGMIYFADIEIRPGGRASSLSMTAEAEVLVTNCQKLRIDGPMRIVAGRASFSQRGVFEDEWPRLFPMTLGARFIQAASGKCASRFHDVKAMGVMALNTVHLAFSDRMMLWKVKFGVDFQMTLITSLRRLARINDKLVTASASSRHMFACWSMA